MVPVCVKLHTMKKIILVVFAILGGVLNVNLRRIVQNAKLAKSLIYNLLTDHVNV